MTHPYACARASYSRQPREPDSPLPRGLDKWQRKRVNATSLPHDPAGWYLLNPSDELPRGRVLPACLAGREIAVFRTEDGEARAVSAFCPHLGAHLGHSGRVVGEDLRCEFHGFCFDAEGACTRTSYGSRPPPKARLRVVPTREKHGLVLGWHDPDDRAPRWEVPDLDLDGWSPLRWRRFCFRGHPQETTENGVDLGHLSYLHGYRGVAVRHPVSIDGPSLRAGYDVTRVIEAGALAVDSREGVVLAMR